MNKLTKLLSVFVIAGAIGTGIAGVAGCKKGGSSTPKHEHKYTYTIDDTDNTKHNGHCAEDGCDAPDINEEHHWNDQNKCKECNAEKPSGEVEHKHNYEWTNNGDGTHSGHCDVAGCDEPDIVNEEHHFGADHRCEECRVKQESYNITFNMHGTGTAPEAQVVYSGEYVTKPETPANTADKYFGGWYENADYTGGKFDFSQLATKTVELHARWLEIKEIGTAEELETFRTTATSEDGTGGLAAGAYVLTADIDLEGKTLAVAASVINDGVIFDGQGHTIKNAVYSGTESKIGLLCKTITGGTVTNVKFLNCAITSISESVGLIAGECNTSSNISKIEFNSCSSVTTNNYAGLIFGRREGSDAIVINMSEITVKNGSYTSCAQYGGLLIGDITATTTVNFKDLHIDGEFKDSSGNGSFIAGRTRDGATVKVENAVISAAMPTANSMGIFAGGGAAKLTLKNILITKTNNANIGATNKTHTVTKENVVTVSDVTVTDVPATGANTVTYLTETLGFDFTNVWTAEGEGGYRLKAASTNVKSADAKLQTLKVSAGNAKIRFKQGEEFITDGLTVMGVYSDGVQLVLTKGVEFEVVSTEYDKTTAGEYTITVHATEAGATAEDVTYKVNVVSETGFEVNDEFISHVYLRNEKLDTTNLVVYSVWSDGVKEKVAAKDIKVGEVNTTAAGKYNVQISYGSYQAKTIEISVVDTKVVPVDGKLYINVDAAAVSESYSGARVNGVETFKNVADAVDYLEACGFENSVQKVIRIKAGEYKAKITTALANLTLIGLGTSADDVKLTYNAVESTVNPLTGSTYGMNCATFHVTGTGFKAYNVFFENSFDYINDSAKESSPQGFALTVNGDGAYIEHCRMYGNQDTFYVKDARVYVKDTLIEGNVDFIFGEGKNLAYFDGCEIKAISRYDESTSNKSNNGYVTAAKHGEDDKPDYGYIFEGCNFTDDGKVLEGAMSLGRPWGKKATVAMLNCTFSAAYSKAAYGAVDSSNKAIKSRWADMSGNLPAGADFCEYHSTGAGAIDTEVDGGTILSDTDAAKYTAANLFAATNGKVSWSAAWDYTAAGTALAALKGALETTAGEPYVSAEEITVAEEGEADLLISLTPWNLEDKSVTVTVADTSIAEYYNGKVYGISEGDTTITVSYTGGTKDIPVSVTAKDPTIRETVNYVYAQNSREDGTVEDSPSKKLKFTDLVVNNSWLRWKDDNASVAFTALKGTIIKITVNGSEVLTFNGEEVAAVDKVVTYTVPADGQVVIKRKSGTSAYFRTLTIYAPVQEFVYNYPYASDSSGAPAQGTAVADAPAYFTGAQYNGDWLKITGKIEFNAVEGTVIKITASSFDKGIIMNGAETELAKDEGTNNYTITITAETAGLVTLTPKENQFYLKAITITAPKTEFSYKYKGENGEEWVATNCAEGKVAKVGSGSAQTDDPDETHVGLQINDKNGETESYLDLSAKGTKATINSIIGYTLGTNNASAWLKIDFIDAGGNVLETVTGTTTANKAFGEYTLSKTEVQTSTEFVKIRFRCESGNTSKSLMINAIDIKAE
ncbi:MAG: pectinesterase family protein [Roseburia sp.]|nr:pectinesterase family protein [Roseburia sp.]